MKCYICKKNKASRKNIISFKTSNGNKNHCICDKCRDGIVEEYML